MYIVTYMGDMQVETHMYTHTDARTHVQTCTHMSTHIDFNKILKPL